MSYQQPPQGYPPQPGYAQPQPGQPPAQYQQPPYQPPAAFSAGDGLALPPNLLVLAAFMLLAGVFVKSITGFFNPGKAWQYIGTISAILLSVGEVALGVSLVNAGLKEKEHATGVKVAALIIGGLLVIHALMGGLGDIAMLSRMMR